jgi:micrococcal nuclease
MRVRRRRGSPFVVLLALALLAVIALVGREDGGSGGGGGSRARAVRAVDGDTVKVSVGGRLESVRVLGIDTPETHRPGTPIECGGPQASAHMVALVRGRPAVTLERDPTQARVDRYGRLLAYVRLPDGRSLGSEQVRAGWAMAYVYDERPVTRYPALRRLEASARAAGRGVWGLCGGRFHSAAGP